MTQMQTHTRSRDVILREEEFTWLLQEASQGFGSLGLSLLAEPELLERGGVTLRLVEFAYKLETFLDDHGARHNRMFVTFGEIVASIRGLSLVRSTGLHLVNRLARYQTVGGSDASELEADLRRGLETLNEATLALFRALVEEGGRLGFTWNKTVFEAEVEQTQRRLLPRNLDADVAVDERQHIAQIGARFLGVLEASRNLGLNRVRPIEELSEYVANHATEERCRYYESTVHNIQSIYDTYVLRTTIERDHSWLQSLRGHTSIAFHLLEMATGLVHFYERHENDIRHEPARETISAVVSKDRVLDVAVNICLRHAYLFVEGAAPLAERILDTFVATDSVSLKMPEGITLHARPLALIVQVVRHYGTPVEITIEGETCSGNSLMGLILVGGRHPRPASMEARGDAAVLKDLRLLFESGLGETGEPLPPELRYLEAK